MSKPYYFVSYSSREPHVENLLDALNLVLGSHFEQRRTPAALESGESQYDQILRGIEDASFGVVIFGVVILDGLRPNVVFEYGIMVGKAKPVLLFREQDAEVDIPGYYFSAEVAAAPRTILLVDSHFSDIKNQVWTTWFRFKPRETRQVVLEEYRKKRDRIPGFIDIAPTEP